MMDLYETLYNRIDEFRTAGFEPDRIIIPANEWEAVKERAEVDEGVGFMGGDETRINDVKATWTSTISSAKITFLEANE